MSECDVCALNLYTRPYNNDDQEASSSLYYIVICKKNNETSLGTCYLGCLGAWVDVGGMVALKMTYGGYKVLQKIVLMICALCVVVVFISIESNVVGNGKDDAVCVEIKSEEDEKEEEEEGEETKAKKS